MINHITHKGVVSHIDGRKVTVLFVQQSACAACSARMLCTSGESKQRSIVADSYGQHFEVGEEVTVEVTSQLAWTAMFFAFGLPAVEALIVVFPAIGWLGEIWAPVAALGALVLYYTILYGFRKKLDRRVVFLLHKV